MKTCACNTQHLPPPMIPHPTGHEMASNPRGRMLQCSERARSQVGGSLMLCGRSSCCRREGLTHFWSFCFRHGNGTQFRLKIKRPEIGKALLASRATIPATQHQRPSNLVASTLREMEHTTSNAWRHLVPSEARNNRRW